MKSSDQEQNVKCTCPHCRPLEEEIRSLQEELRSLNLKLSELFTQLPELRSRYKLEQEYLEEFGKMLRDLFEKVYGSVTWKIAELIHEGKLALEDGISLLEVFSPDHSKHAFKVWMENFLPELPYNVPHSQWEQKFKEHVGSLPPDEIARRLRVYCPVEVPAISMTH